MTGRGSLVRSWIRVGSLGALLTGCGQAEKASQHADGVAAGGDVTVRSAITAQPGLAHPEYDLDTPVEFFGFGTGSVSDIDGKRAEGFRLLSVSAYTPFLYSAALVRNEGDYFRDGNGWDNQLTEAELMDIVNNDPTRRIVDIAPYQFLGQRFYAAVWVAKDQRSTTRSSCTPRLTRSRRRWRGAPATG